MTGRPETCSTHTIEIVKAGVIVLCLIRGNRDSSVASIVVLLKPCLQLAESLIVPAACLLVEATRSIGAGALDGAAFGFSDGHVDQKAVGIGGMGCDEVFYLRHPLCGYAIDVLP